MQRNNEPRRGFRHIGNLLWWSESQNNIDAGCLKWPSSEAPGEGSPGAYPLGYVEDAAQPRTKLAAIFNILAERSTE